MSESDEKKSKWRILNNSAKIAAALVCLVICWNLIEPVIIQNQNAAELEASDSELASVDPEALDGATNPFGDFMSGNWVFGNAEWDYQFRPWKSDQDLLELPKGLRQADPEFNDRLAIEEFEAMNAEMKPLGGDWQAYVSENEDNLFLQVLLVKGQTVQLMRTKLPGSESFNVIEGRPRKTVSNHQQLFLPLMAGVTQTAYRKDASEKLTAAMFELDQLHEFDLLKFWKSKGFDFEPANAVFSEQESRDIENQVARYFCIGEQRNYQATFFRMEGGMSSIVVGLPKP